MSSTRLLGCAVCALTVTMPVLAGSHHGGGSPHGHGGFSTAGVPAAVGGGWGFYGLPYYSMIGPYGMPAVFMPPLFVAAPGGFFPAFVPPMGGLPGWNGGRVAGPWPPPGWGPRRVAAGAAKPKKGDPARAAQLMTFGDRLFRAGNYRRATERYEQAARADPHAAAPRVRLAQVALVRGQFAEAANQLREAITAEPDWLSKATDIQAIYGEPADFAKQIAKLESHLQAEPQDRDAWLVLGAQWFLSGRTEKAADIFLRLSDRKADAALTAFLDASQPPVRAR